MNTHSLHQRLAILYLALSIPILGWMISDLYENPIENAVLIRLIFIVGVIAPAPLLVLRSPFRKWFYWPDALSEEEMGQLQSRDASGRHRLPKSSLSRTNPYFIRGFTVIFALYALLSLQTTEWVFVTLAQIYLLGLPFFFISPVYSLERRERTSHRPASDAP